MVKGTAWDKTTINGLTIKSISVKYVDRIPKIEDISLDLSNADSYVIDGGNTTAAYKDGVLDVSVALFEGIIFKNPAENPADYKYVTVTYTSDRDINAYIFDGQMGNGGKGQTPAGQVQKDALAKAGTEAVATYEAEKAMYGLKLVHIDGSNGAPIGLKIKSVVFSNQKPETPPTATATPEPTATPVPEETAIPIDKGEAKDTMYGKVYEYTIPSDASKLQASFVKNGKEYTETLGISMLENEIKARESIWAVVKSVSDRDANAEPFYTNYADDGAEVSVKKTAKNTAEITVKEDGKEDRVITVKFTAADTAIDAEVTEDDRKCEVKVTSDKPNEATVIYNEGSVHKVVAEKNDTGYSVTVNTAGGNYVKIEKAGDVRTLVASVALVEKYSFELGYFKGGDTPGPNETPDPNKTPGPNETPDPNKTPGPNDTPDPNKTPGPNDTPDPNKTPGPNDTPDPNKTPGPNDTPDPNKTPGPEDTPTPATPTPRPTPRPPYGTLVEGVESESGEDKVYEMPLTANTIDLAYTKDGEASKVVLDFNLLKEHSETYGTAYEALDRINSMTTDADTTKWFYIDPDDKKDCDYVYCKKVSDTEAELKVVNQGIENNYKLSFVQSEIDAQIARVGDDNVITARIECEEDGAVYTVTVSSGDRNCMNVLKDGASESYTVALENSDGTFTITATTPSGNEIVISKSDDSFVMTVTKDFAEALGLEVHAMGSDTVKPLVVNAAIAPSSKSLITGEKTELIVSVDKGDIDSVEWTVEGDADAVTVVQDTTNKAKFTVTAVKAGTATLKAEVTAKSGERPGKGTATATITVKNDYNPEVTLTGAPAEMSVNDTADLTVSVNSGNITSVKWTVEGDAVTVQDTTEKTNRVTAVKAGTATVKATVTAEDADGTEKTVESEPAVINVKYEPKVTIYDDLATDTLAVKGTMGLSVDVENASIQDVQWSVDKEDIAEIVPDVAKIKAAITAKKEGKVTVTVIVTAKDNDSGLTGTSTATKEIEVEYKVATSVNKTLGIDLSNPDSYVIDGGSTTAHYNNATNTLEVSVANVEGIIFKNPAQNPDDYKYVTLTYSSDKDISSYVFDETMTDGIGNGAAGSHDISGGLKKADNLTTVTYEWEKMHALKLVQAVWPFDNSVSPANLNVKSVVFSTDDPSKSDESNKMQVNDTAVLSAGVDIGDVKSVEWSITAGEDIATIIKSNDESKAVIIANKVGRVTVEAKVTAEFDGMKAEDTSSYEIEVTPITYNINEELTFTSFPADGNNWNNILLDNPIKIKKTDEVEVIFSVKSGNDDTSLKEDTATKIGCKLSPKILSDTDVAGNQYKISELATLEANQASVAGTVGFKVVETWFKGIYTEIKNISLRSDKPSSGSTVVVKVEKIKITPTDKIAISLTAPSAVVLNNTVEAEAEIYDAYDEIRWTSSDPEKATVEIVSGTNGKKATVKGVANGKVTITAKVFKDNVEAASDSFDISVMAEEYKDIPKSINPQNHADGDLTTVTNKSDNSILIMGEGSGIHYKLPYKLATNEKIKVRIVGNIGSGSSGFRLYTTAGAKPDVGGGSNTETLFQELGEGDFDRTVTLTATKDCEYLMLRQANTGTWNINNVTIDEIIVTYID